MQDADHAAYAMRRNPRVLPCHGDGELGASAFSVSGASMVTAAVCGEIYHMRVI